MSMKDANIQTSKALAWHEEREKRKIEFKKSQLEKIKSREEIMKDWFYQDLRKKYSSAVILATKQEQRTINLIKAGYMDEDMRITDLGFEKLIQHLVDVVNNRFNVNDLNKI